MTGTVTGTRGHATVIAEIVVTALAEMIKISYHTFTLTRAVIGTATFNFAEFSMVITDTLAGMGLRAVGTISTTSFLTGRIDFELENC
jgi:hypothetical protein